MKKKQEKSNFLGHSECVACGSSDGVAVYETGGCKCMVCDAIHKNPNETPEGFEVVPNADYGTSGVAMRFGDNQVKKKKVPLETIQAYPTRGFKERAIPKDICEFFGVKAFVNQKGEIEEHYYPYGVDKVVGYKVRALPKTFRVSGDLEGLFGQSKFNGGKRLIITEGELDAMAVATASMKKYGQIYPVVSLPSASGTKALLEQRDWVRQFDEVVLMLDNDEAGKKALDKACSIIGIDKVKIAKLKENTLMMSYLSMVTWTSSRLSGMHSRGHPLVFYKVRFCGISS